MKFLVGTERTTKDGTVTLHTVTDAGESFTMRMNWKVALELCGGLMKGASVATTLAGVPDETYFRALATALERAGVAETTEGQP